jgi:branched-subunit amino acid ABC-type transport system permease component
MGFAMIMQNSVTALWGNTRQSLSILFGGGREKAIRIAGIGFFPEEIFIILASLIVMIIFLVLCTGPSLARHSAVSFNPIRLRSWESTRG